MNVAASMTSWTIRPRSSELGVFAPANALKTGSRSRLSRAGSSMSGQNHCVKKLVSVVVERVSENRRSTSAS